MNRNKFEDFFKKFVADFGGEVLPEVHSVKYADYIFRGDRIVVELKTLEEDKTLDHARKIQELAMGWQKRGLFFGFGTIRISLPNFRHSANVNGSIY